MRQILASIHIACHEHGRHFVNNSGCVLPKVWDGYDNYFAAPPKME